MLASLRLPRGVPALTLDEAGAFAPPAAFGPFRVLHQIGIGVLGPVFRTYDPQRDRLVAVKVFRVDLVPEQARAVAAELDRMTQLSLSHPAIVLPVAAGVEGTVAYLATEYVAGESLDVAMRHYAPAPLEKALPFLIQIAGAIDAASQAGLNHGALHPRDIFISPEQARVTGFGVTAALERVGVRAPVRRPYTAPERIAGTPWGAPADVYSLAAITYELLTGRRLAGDPEQIAAALADVKGSPSVPRLRDVITSALADQPERRPASAGAFVTGLAQAMARPATADAAHAPEAPARAVPVETVTPAAPFKKVAPTAQVEPVAPAAPSEPVAPGVPAGRRRTPKPRKPVSSLAAPPAPPGTTDLGAMSGDLLSSGTNEPAERATQARPAGTPGATVSKDTAGATVSKDTPGATVSKDTADAPVSKDTAGAPVSKDTAGATASKNAPGAADSTQMPVVTDSPERPVATNTPVWFPAPEPLPEPPAVMSGKKAEKRGVPVQGDRLFTDQHTGRRDVGIDRPLLPPVGALPGMPRAPAPAREARIRPPEPAPDRNVIARFPPPLPTGSGAGGVRLTLGWFALALSAGIAVSLFFAGYYLGLRSRTSNQAATALQREAGAGPADKAFSEQPVAEGGATDAQPAPAAAPPAIPREGAAVPLSPAASKVAGPEVSAAPSIAGGHLVVRSTPAGARVIVNGTARGVTPVELKNLPFGKYQIDVIRSGYVKQSRSVALSASRRSSVSTIELRPEAPAVIGTGSLYIASRPTRAVVLIDGRKVGTTPMRVPQLRPGAHRVQLELAGYRNWSSNVTIKAGEEVRVAVPLQR